MASDDKEVLTCKDCKKDWLRDVKRGRKPVRCPECDSNNDDSLEELTCEDCGRDWHRVVKRGGKPKKCFVCDGIVEEPEEEEPEPEPEEEESNTETLTCELCGEDWEREPKPGRKPKTCPNCKNKPRKKKKSSKSKTNTSKKKKKKRKKKVTKDNFENLQEVIDEIEPIGEALEVRCNNYKKYLAFELFDGDIKIEQGAMLDYTEKRSATYKFKALVLRPDGTGYCDLTGVSDKYYANKHRAIGLDKLTIN